MSHFGPLPQPPGDPERARRLALEPDAERPEAAQRERRVVGRDDLPERLRLGPALGKAPLDQKLPDNSGEAVFKIGRGATVVVRDHYHRRAAVEFTTGGVYKDQDSRWLIDPSGSVPSLPAGSGAKLRITDAADATGSATVITGLRQGRYETDGRAFLAGGRPASEVVAAPIASAGAPDQLRQLKAMHDEGLLSDDEYETKRRQVLERL